MTLILVFLSLGASLPGFAESPLQVDALLGFNGVAREGRFAPLIVSIANAGTRIPVDVRVDVSWGSSLRGTQESRVFTRESVLGGGATRRLSFLVPMAPDARSLDLSVSSQGVELARQSVDLRAQVTRDRLVAVVASELSLDSIAGMSDGTGSVRVVYPRIDDLPETWAAYDGIDMVVIHDTYFQQLRAAQVSALERWVVTGGTVVFTGGVAGLQHEDAGLGQLLPVRVTGLVARVGLPAVARLAGVARAPRGSAVLCDSRVTTGEVLAGEGDLPLVVERRLGRGGVWFLAFDPTLAPFAVWEGMLPLWRLMGSRDRQPTLQAESLSPLDDPWMRVMIGSPALALPSVLLVLACAGCYCALFIPLVSGRFLRGMKSGLRIVLLVAIPLAASAGSGIVFDRILFRAAPRALDAAVVEMRSGDGLAMVTEKIGIVTAQAGVVDIAAGAHDLPVDELDRRPAVPGERSSSPAPFTVALGDTALLKGLTLGRYGSRLLVLQDVIPMPVTARAETQQFNPHGDGVQRIRPPALFLFPLDGRPRLPAGRYSPERGGEPVIRAAGLRGPGDARVVDDPTREALWNLVAQGVNGPVIAGWLDGSPLPLAYEGAEPAAGRAPLALVLVEPE